MTDTGEQPDARPRILLVVVGSRLSAAGLSGSLGAETRSRFSLVFARSDHFGPQDLFRARLDSSADIHVWVDTNTPGVVHLYFANRAGTRYLVRTMELSDQLDEMDREALAQAIEWSLEALVEGTGSLTREEAKSLLGPPDPAPVPAVSAPAAPRTDPPRPPCWRRRCDGWLPEMASFYRVAGYSGEIPIAHGPGLRVGVDRLLSARQVGVAGSVQYSFPGRRDDGRIGLELRTIAVRLELRTVETKLARDGALTASVGTGWDTTWALTEAHDSYAFKPEPTRSSTTRLVTGRLGWQWRLTPVVRVEASAGADADFVSMHYDVVTADGTQRFVRRWPVRPSASMSAEFW